MNGVIKITDITINGKVFSVMPESLNSPCKACSLKGECLGSEMGKICLAMEKINGFPVYLKSKERKNK